MIYGFAEVIDATLTEDGKMIITKRKRSQTVYGNGIPVPDEVWREVYESVDGRIVMKRRIDGKHTPRAIVEERMEFPD
jgi:hypothetical protein